MSMPLPTVSKTQLHFIEMPSPSMHEGVLGEVAPGDYTMQLAQEALRVIRLAGEGSYKAARAIHADETLSEGAKHVRAHEVTYKLTNRVLPIADRANSTLQTEVNRLKRRLMLATTAWLSQSCRRRRC
jgi:hypothetical protein